MPILHAQGPIESNVASNPHLNPNPEFGAWSFCTGNQLSQYPFLHTKPHCDFRDLTPPHHDTTTLLKADSNMLDLQALKSHIPHPLSEP
jgi:hypothetical protein